MSYDDYEEPSDDLDDEGDDEEDLEAQEVDRLCREALSRLEDEDVEAGRDLAMEAIAIDDEHPFPLFVLGLIADHEGDAAGARYFADRALQTAGTNADAISFRAQLHLKDFEFADAERLLRFGIVHNPDDAQLHESLARVFLAEGKMNEAVQSAHASLRIDPSNHGAHAVRVAALDETGDAEGMLAVLRQAVQMHPDDPYSMVELAAVEAEHGNVDRARVLLARAQRLAPRDAQVSDVRMMIEGAHDHRLLQPLPGMLRWVREFPGGLVGFLLAFVIASMPLHALASAYPEYAVATWGLLWAWALGAAYMWIGPAVMTARLNRLAARGAAARMRTEFAEHARHADPLAGRGMLGTVPLLPTAVPPGLERRDVAADGTPVVGESPVHAVRLIDTVALLFQGRAFREGVRLVREAALAADQPLAGELDTLSRRLRTVRARAFYRVATVPGDVRMLVCAAVGLATGAPVLARELGGVAVAYHAASIGLAIVAWGIVRGETRLLRMLDATLAEIRIVSLAEAGGNDAGEDDGPRLRAAG